jgi:hypothetical protein
MKLVRELVPRPKGSGSLSSSALFRAVDARKCTLLVDEGDYVFRDDINPDMAAIYNSGNERTFAVVTRSVPLGEGQFEDQDFSTFTGICFTSIDKLRTKSMQSRCISLAMKPATKEESAKLSRFRASKCQELKDCGRKIARWAADLAELPDIEVPDDFVNRVADNWRSLFQIAHLAGGDWPARVLAAAKADAAGDGEIEVERGAGGLLDAIWRVFAAEATNPRRMHTSDLVQKLMNLDDGRWRVANRGKPIDEYFLRSKLKGYVTPPDKGGEAKIPRRSWRPKGSPTEKWGYHELHFKDAFLRYLGKGLPSEAPPEQTEDEKDKSSEYPFSPNHPHTSAASTASGSSPDSSKTSTAADDAVDVDGQSTAKPQRASEQAAQRMPHPHPQPASEAGQANDKSDKNISAADAVDLGGSNGERGSKEESNATRFPRGPVGRKSREA